MHLRVILLALTGRTGPVRPLVGLLGGFVVAADLPGATAEPALEGQRADVLLAAAAAVRALDQVAHFTPLPEQSQHLIHLRGLLPGFPLP